MTEGWLGGAGRKSQGHSANARKRPTRCLGLSSARPASSNQPGRARSNAHRRPCARCGGEANLSLSVEQVRPGGQRGICCGPNGSATRVASKLPICIGLARLRGHRICGTKRRGSSGQPARPRQLSSGPAPRISREVRADAQLSTAPGLHQNLGAARPAARRARKLGPPRAAAFMKSARRARAMSTKWATRSSTKRTASCGPRPTSSGETPAARKSKSVALWNLPDSVAKCRRRCRAHAPAADPLPPGGCAALVCRGNASDWKRGRCAWRQGAGGGPFCRDHAALVVGPSSQIARPGRRI